MGLRDRLAQRREEKLREKRRKEKQADDAYQAYLRAWERNEKVKQDRDDAVTRVIEGQAHATHMSRLNEYEGESQAYAKLMAKLHGKHKRIIERAKA